MRQRGFTLVELAIVMTIIGLLIGGIIKGQELMLNARITATIAQVNSYAAATITFRDSYSQLPGDMLQATSRLPNCGAANFCVNGDANGLIGLNTGAAVSGASDFSGTTVPQIETTMFFKHLAMADIVAGVETGSNPAVPAWGQTHPSARIGGGFTVLYWLGGYNVGKTGHWLRLQSNTGDIFAAGAGPISARKAVIIDQKMDEGLPQRGYVQSVNLTGSCVLNEAADLNGTYRQASDAPDCVMYFHIY